MPVVCSFVLETFIDVALKLQGAVWVPTPLTRGLLYEQVIQPVRDGVEFWRDVFDKPVNVLAFYGGAKTIRETKQLMPKKGDKQKATVKLVREPIFTAGIFDAGPREPTLSVTFSDTGEFWNVRASDVTVTCMPISNEAIKQHYSWLRPIDWEPEF
jgi:hypothetical protein